MTDAAQALRWVPAVHVCLANPPAEVIDQRAGERLERRALEVAMVSVRQAIRHEPEGFDSQHRVVQAVHDAWNEALTSLARLPLRRVINATGVIVHTNLGRAPLAAEAIEASRQASLGYTALEYDLQRGERGSRYAHATDLIKIATGAEDALVVNNNAAALVLAVDTLADGKSVVVSRGELIEIGGGFRIHEIIAKTSARLVEVGATNKTHLEDYSAAVAALDVGALLKVHRSNFEQTGFVAEVDVKELCRFGAAEGVPVIFDQGTGVLEPLGSIPGEPTVREAIEAGAAVVCASGDKLLGGPQAGLICGTRDWIGAMKSNPLLRALRVDKLTLSALDATLRLALSDPDQTPVTAMMKMTLPEASAAVEAIVDQLAKPAREQCTVSPHPGRAGGGTLPAVQLPGQALKVVPTRFSAADLEIALRSGEPPIITRVVDDAVWLDVRTLLPGDSEIVAKRLNELLLLEER